MIKVEKTDKYGYVCEVWASSTKHPDSRFFFKDYKKIEWLPEEQQIFQWLLECASKLTWPFCAKQLTVYALKNWYLWDKE